MITTDKILAHKLIGKNLVLLSQVGSSYFLTFAKVQTVKRGILGYSKRSIQVIAEKEITEEEACHIYSELTKDGEVTAESVPLLQAPGIVQQTQYIHKVSRVHPEGVTQTLLLSGGVSTHVSNSSNTRRIQVFPSPYFPTKEILLSVQQTRAPSIA